MQIAYDSRVKISAICSELNVDGIRGDIVTNRAAKALASFEGRDEVAVEDIYRYATCASVACMRSDCFCPRQYVRVCQTTNKRSMFVCVRGGLHGGVLHQQHRGGPSYLLSEASDLSCHLSHSSTRCDVLLNSVCARRWLLSGPGVQGYPPVPASPLEEGSHGRH